MKKSKGHIAFVGSNEFYLERGQIFKAPMSAAFDLEGRRQGRWYGDTRKATFFMIGDEAEMVKKNRGKVSVAPKYKKQVRPHPINIPLPMNYSGEDVSVMGRLMNEMREQAGLEPLCESEDSLDSAISAVARRVKATLATWSRLKPKMKLGRGMKVGDGDKVTLSHKWAPKLGVTVVGRLFLGKRKKFTPEHGALLEKLGFKKKKNGVWHDYVLPGGSRAFDIHLVMFDPDTRKMPYGEVFFHGELYDKAGSTLASQASHTATYSHDDPGIAKTAAMLRRKAGV